MTDFVIIGSGIAGLATALKAAAYGHVTVLTKGRVLESNTFFAQGGIAAALGPGDTPEFHLRDTLLAGAEMCNPDAVAILVESGPRRILELIELGTQFDKNPDGQLAFGREGAHRHPRVLHARGDATGAEIASVLARATQTHPNITLHESAVVTDLIIHDGRCVGCWVFDANRGETVPVFARACIIATGGCGQLYRYTTNPWIATGDGLAMAYRAGAKLIDMEFVQFHPTALAHHDDPMVLISEAVRGEGAVLIDDSGRRFMTEVHEMAELAPRDIVARAIFTKMQQGQNVYLDATHLGEGFKQRFPSIYQACLQRNIDPTHEPIPVAPAAHFIMGGIYTDTNGRTTIPGLFACGEAACTGVHGANRLASNSLLEGLVFAEQIAQALADEPSFQRMITPSSTAAYRGGNPTVRQPELEQTLRQVLWNHAGLIRSRTGLETALDQLAQIEAQADAANWTLNNMLTVARLIVRGALVREESRGGHFRSDFPTPRAHWRNRHVVHHKDAAEPWLETHESSPTYGGETHESHLAARNHTPGA